ncbi:MAG: hypothetical protein JWM10_4631 [Myxococcaceae bacterium]|nr:hypothetical protein [Myxococcaceae bacterium]
MNKEQPAHATIDVKELKRALVATGLEVFRVRGNEVHLAERQNLHLMEARVQVAGGGSPAVTVVLHAQRSDAPKMDPASLLDVVRERAAGLRSDGYEEVDARPREICSVNDGAVLDVWYEVTLRRGVSSLDEAVSEAQRVISVERYVIPGARD